MNEKLAINDILQGTHSQITALTSAIQQANSITFRNLCIEARIRLDTLSYDIYLLAKEKNYYVPAAIATTEEIDVVKNLVTK